MLKKTTTIAQEVMMAEAQAILQAADLLNDSFEEVVNTILAATGRVIVSGVGKSALIGQKIVATMNSTGTPALFMHAADAIHGDLGMVQTNDVALILSKSGNTPEIKVLVPLVKRIGIPLIALVSDMQSYLAQHADYILQAYCRAEADPHNLAPTNSTTVSLALGDALAIALLDKRGFTRQDFARYHPGGVLGKKLYLKVSDIFPANECPTVHPDTHIHNVLFEMSAKRLGATAVVNANHEVIGIITDGDIRRMAYEHQAFLGLTAQQIMTPTPITIDSDAYAVSALQLMQERNISQLIVTDSQQHLLGFVHLHDLLKEGIV